MIEFTLNRNKNGKKSRWAKKYPRKRILKRGSEKAEAAIMSGMGHMTSFCGSETIAGLEEYSTDEIVSNRDKDKFFQERYEK